MENTQPSLYDQFISSLSPSADDDEVLHDACKQITRIFNCRRTALLNLSESGNDGVVIAHYPESENTLRGKVVKVKGVAFEENIFIKKHTVMIANIERELTDPELKEHFRDLGINSSIIAPIAVSNRVMASIGIDRTANEEPFTMNDKAQLELITKELGVILCRRERNLLNAMLNAVSQFSTKYAPGVAHDEVELYQSCYEFLRELMPVKNYYLALYDHNTGRLTFPFAIENETNVTGAVAYKERLFGNGMTEFVINSAAPLLVRSNVQTFLQKHGIDPIGEMACSWIGAPLIYNDKILGIMGIQDFSIENAYNDNHLKVLSIMANQIAYAIKRNEYRLRDQKQKKIEEEITRLTSVVEIANRLLDLTELVVPFHRATFQLIKQEGYREIIAIKGYSDDKINRELLKPVYRDKLISRIFDNKLPYILADVSKEADWDGSYVETSDIMSWVGIPIMSGESRIGVITLDHTNVNHFTESLMNEIIRLADKISLTIQKAIITAEYATLAEVVNTFSSTHDLQELLKRIVKVVNRKLHSPQCSIFMPEQLNGETYLCPKYYEGSETIGKRKFATGEGFAGWVFANKKSKMSNAAEQDPVYSKMNPDNEQKYGTDHQALMVVPIMFEKMIFGVVCISHEMKDGYAFFSDQDLIIAEIIAQHAGAAIYRLDMQNEFLLAQQNILSSQTIPYLGATFMQRSLHLLKGETAVWLLFDKNSNHIIHQGANPEYSKDILLPMLKNKSLEILQRGENEYYETSEDCFPAVNSDDTAQVSILSVFVAGDVVGAIFISGNKSSLHLTDIAIGYFRALTYDVKAMIIKMHYKTVAFESMNSATIGRITRNLAHQIRGPLNGIKGSFEYLIKSPALDENSRSDNSIAENIRIISKYLDQSILTINTLLKNAVDENAVEYKFCRLSDIMTEVLLITRRNIEQNKITVKNELSGTHHIISVYANYATLVNAFINIVTNAIDAMPAGGILRIYAEELFHPQSSRYMTKLVIADTGVGIAETVKESIFNDVKTTKSKGTGIGLILSKQLIAFNNGWIEYEKNNQIGTAFSIFIPKNQGERE